MFKTAKVNAFAKSVMKQAITATTSSMAKAAKKYTATKSEKVDSSTANSAKAKS